MRAIPKPHKYLFDKIFRPNATNLNNVYTRFVLAIALQISYVFYLGNVFEHQSQMIDQECFDPLVKN